MMLTDPPKDSTDHFQGVLNDLQGIAWFLVHVIGVKKPMTVRTNDGTFHYVPFASAHCGYLVPNEAAGEPVICGQLAKYVIYLKDHTHTNVCREHMGHAIDHLKPLKIMEISTRKVVYEERPGKAKKVDGIS